MSTNEWITDRLPTEADARGEMGVWTMHDGKVMPWSWQGVAEGQPWQPIAKPKPYVKPKRFNAEWSEGYKCWYIRCDKETGFENAYQWGLTKKDEHSEAAERIAAIYEEVMS